ncbi:hypothetical protein GCM10023196_053960 [Actinoallomurus vinaceus]|uniref:Uncharacterized protein n=1 Tax=Actinoallomurus vinaceus TaxID=1080074 RepID=A0ABP8UHK6_9ACTN
MGFWGKKAGEMVDASNEQHRQAIEAKDRGDMKAYKRHMKAASAFGSEARDAHEQGQREREAALKELDRQQAAYWRKKLGN